MKNSPDCTISYAEFLVKQAVPPSPARTERPSSDWEVGGGSLEQQQDYVSFEKAPAGPNAA